MTQKLKELYNSKVVTNLLSELNYTHKFEVPMITKIVLNRGISYVSQSTIDSSNQELSLITGQKTVTVKAKKAIAGFKLREGTAVGISVTLRGEKMYAFLDRLINLALPRIKDFQGLNLKSFDTNGNYTFGLDEQLMFPEIKYEKIDKIRGMTISIITTANSDTEAIMLLKQLGMPFQII